jgi:hypothetical protein
LIIGMRDSRDSRSISSLHAGGNGAVRLERLGAAAQDAGVARFHAQRRGVGGHVGAGLVDDADDADRHAHPRHFDAGRALDAPGDLPDGVGELRHLLDALGHLLDELRRQRQPVDECGVGAVFPCLSDIGAVGGKNCLRAGPDVLRHGGESAILLLGFGAGQRACGSARRAAQLADVLPNVKLLIHGPILAQAQ